MARIVIDLDMRLLFLSRTRLISLPNAGAPTITPKSKAALTARDVGHCGYSFCKASPLDFSRVMCPQARPDSLEFSAVTVTPISAVITAAEATEEQKVSFRVTPIPPSRPTITRQRSERDVHTLRLHSACRLRMLMCRL